MIFFLKNCQKSSYMNCCELIYLIWIGFFLNERLNNQSLVKNGNLFFFSKRTLPT